MKKEPTREQRVKAREKRRRGAAVKGLVAISTKAMALASLLDGRAYYTKAGMALRLNDLAHQYAELKRETEGIASRKMVGMVSREQMAARFRQLARRIAIGVRYGTIIDDGETPVVFVWGMESVGDNSDQHVQAIQNQILKEWGVP